MNLKEIQELLSENNISFHQVQYENEAEFYHHIMLFPYTAKCKKRKTISLEIPSKNGKKNIEIQFCEAADDFLFADLWFGGFSFDMFDTAEDFIASELLSNITEIMECRVVFLEANDMKHKRWLSDAVFEYDENGDGLGPSDYRRTLQRIEKPKSLFSKIMKTRTLYEIFDWESYKSIEK